MTKEHRSTLATHKLDLPLNLGSQIQPWVPWDLPVNQRFQHKNRELGLVGTMTKTSQMRKRRPVNGDLRITVSTQITNATHPTHQRKGGNCQSSIKRPPRVSRHGQAQRRERMSWILLAPLVNILSTHGKG